VVVGLGYCLVALHDLVVRITIQGNISVKALGEAVDSCGRQVAVLVHEAEVEDDRGRVRVIVTADHLKDALCSIKVLKAL